MLVYALIASISLIATPDFGGSQLIAVNLPGLKIPDVESAREPALAPDRKTLLYWNSGTTTAMDAPIYRADFTTGTKALIAKGNLRSPGYNWANTHIFYTSFRDSNWRLMIQPMDGEARPVSLGEDGVFMPVWSPRNDALVVQDMTNVYWVNSRGERVHAYPISTFATDATRISSADNFTDRPGEWTTVAFSQAAQGDKGVRDEETGFTSAIFVVDLVKKSRRRLTGQNIHAEQPRWTRDGSTIVFRGWVGASRGIFSIPFEGGTPTRLTSAFGEFSL